jgi:hypothetical protein
MIILRFRRRELTKYLIQQKHEKEAIQNDNPFHNSPQNRIWAYKNPVMELQQREQEKRSTNCQETTKASVYYYRYVHTL